MSRPALPPRLKHWQKGKNQVGIFVRNEDGDVIEITHNDAPSSVVKLLGQAAGELLKIPRPIPGANRFTDREPVPED